MATDSEIAKRILAAADSLFEQGGQSQFPTVDAVRKAARVNMNDASAVMKEWRRNHLARRQPAPVQLPPALEQVHRSALEHLWATAQDLAGQHLASLSAAWDTERAEFEHMNAEMAEAFEAQAGELAQARQASDLLKQQAADAQASAQHCRLLLESSQAKLAQAESRASTEAARVAEIERRATDLRAELDRAHASLAEQRRVAAALDAEHAAALSAAREKGAAEQAALEQQLQAAQHTIAALQLREATLQGEVAAVRDEFHGLIQIVSSVTGKGVRAASGYSESKRQ
ncbi:DNA-binding protein [Oxalobacteraceae bacterium A2-2]